jgi:hypothetical protein
MNAPRPLGFFGTCRESARQTLLRLRHHRVWTFVVIGAVLMAGIAWLVGNRVGDRETGRGVYCLLAWWVQATVVMPWLTLYLGVQALHGGLEDRTFQYLFLRPVSRVALLLGNWLAVSLVGPLVGASARWRCSSARRAGRPVARRRRHWAVPRQFAPHLCDRRRRLRGGAMLFSAWFRRPLVWAAFFVVGLQQVTANLPSPPGLRQATITDPLRRLLLDGSRAGRPSGARPVASRVGVPPELIGIAVLDLGPVHRCERSARRVEPTTAPSTTRGCATTGGVGGRCPRTARRLVCPT